MKNFFERWVLLFALVLPISIILSETAAFLLVLLWAVLWWRGGIEHPRGQPLLAPVALLGGWIFLSLLWSVRPDLTLEKLHQPLLLLLVLAVPAALPSGKERAVVLAAAGFVLGASLLALYDLVRVPLAVKSGTPLFYTGNMRDPQLYLLGFCLAVGLAAGRVFYARRAWVWTALLLNAAGLILHFKRGVWLSAVVALLVMAWAARKRWLVVLVLGLLLGSAAIPQVRERWSALETEATLSAGGRYALWSLLAPALLRERPQGVGWSAVVRDEFRERSAYVQPGLDHLHNNLVQVAYELGWAGLACWLFFIGRGWVAVYRGARRPDEPATHGARLVAVACLGGVAGLLFNGLFEYNFGDTEILMALCFTFGLGCAASRLAAPA